MLPQDSKQKAPKRVLEEEGDGQQEAPAGMGLHSLPQEEGEEEQGTATQGVRKAGSEGRRVASR